MRCTLSQCLATAAVLSFAVVAPAARHAQGRSAADRPGGVPIPGQRRDADGTTTPLRVFRNLVADVSGGAGTVEWTRPDGSVATIAPVDPAGFVPQP